MTRLVLASTSPWRLDMLRRAGIEAIGADPEVHERSDEADPARRARALAERKARAVAARHPDAWVLGADQVVWDGDRISGKPTDPVDHARHLAAMRGRAHDLVTGVAIVGDFGVRVFHEVTRMHVRADITDDEIARYVATGEGAKCAGGYAVEGRGAFLFEAIDGDFFNVIGLPLLRVISELRALGWRFGAAAAGERGVTG